MPPPTINKKELAYIMSPQCTRDQRVALCGVDWSLFFCYYFIDYIKYPFAPFHFDFFQDMRDLIAGKYREVAWVAYRESAKTSFSKIFLTWLICYQKRKYINVDSFDRENSERILFDIVVQLQTNPRIRADFGKLYDTKKDTNEATQTRQANFVTTNKIRVEAHGTGESVRGRLHDHQRPDFLLLDDFETNFTKDSEARTAQVIGHIDEFKSGLDSDAKILYLGNYITEYGSINSLKERAETDPRLLYRQVDVIGKDGKPTWPRKYVLTDAEVGDTGKVSLEDKRRQLGRNVFSAEMMNEPIDKDSQEFFESWFKYVPLDQVLRQKSEKIATIDTAESKKKGDDATGVVRNYIIDGEWNIRARGHRINSKGVIDLIFKLHAEGFTKIGIEEMSYVEAIKPFFMDKCRELGIFPRLIMLQHGGTKKEKRIESLIPYYEAGVINHIVGECNELESQALRFPKAKHDDSLDALAYMTQLVKPNIKPQNKPLTYGFKAPKMGTTNELAELFAPAPSSREIIWKI